jgi:hypothetical protein
MTARTVRRASPPRHKVIMSSLPDCRRAAFVTVLVLSVTASACGSGGRGAGDEWGDPRASPRPTVHLTDSGAGTDTGPGSDGARAGDASPRDGGMGERSPAGGVEGGGTGGSGGSGGAGPGAPEVGGADTHPLTACEKCETDLCHDQGIPAVFAGSLLDRCFAPTTRKVGGNSPDLGFDVACKAVVACMRSTRCAGPPDSDAIHCYCGANLDRCAEKGAAAGPCKRQIEDAFGDDDPALILSDFYTAGKSALGVAGQLILCDNNFCSPPCFGYADMAGKPANNCLARDPISGIQMNSGNPACDGDPCRNEGKCVPRAECEKLEVCAPAGDGGAAPDALSSDLDATVAPPVPDGGIGDLRGGGPDGRPDAGAPLYDSPRCLSCQTAAIALGSAGGGCAEFAGCSNLPPTATTEEKRLCQEALDCMRRTGCGVTDALDCLCGTAKDDACLSRADGVCKAQLMAAAKTTSSTTAANLFFQPAAADGVTILPIAYATTLVSCDKELCSNECLTGAGATADAGPTPGPDALTRADAVSPTDLPPPSDGAPPPRDAGLGDSAPPHDAAVDAAPPECPDLDGNGQLDCRETLVRNAGFAADAAGWTAEFGATQAFDLRNAQPSPAVSSGSLALTNGTVTAGSTQTFRARTTQCLSAAAGTSYTVHAQAMLVPGGAPEGGGGVSLTFYGGADCSGTVVGTPFRPDLARGAGSWTIVGGTTAGPAGARSMAVRLVAEKVASAPTLTVLFDNVLVKAR